MEKIFNFRPLVIMLICFVLGVICTLCFLVSNLFLAISFLISTILVLTLAFLFRRKLNIKNIFLLITIICVFIGCLSTFVSSTIYFSSNLPEEVVLIEGRVSRNLGETSSKAFNCYLLENIKYTGASTEKISGKVIIYVAQDEDESFKVGDVLRFTGNFQALSIKDVAGYSTYRRNVRATIFVKNDITLVKHTSYTLFESVRENIKSALNKNMDEVNAGIYYTMLTGDTTTIDENVELSFQKTGIAHLLAVSGLHIGFLVVLIDFILKRFNLKNKTRFFIITPLLFVYCFLCEFTPSVTRAFVMTSVVLLSKSFGRQYDGLTSLCLSALIILLFKPLYIVDRGFLLSFFAVLSIITLSPIFKGWFECIISEKLASSLALVISAQIGVAPLTIIFFGNISLLSIFVNLILIPIASLGYMLTFIMLIITMIFPYLGFILKIPELLINIVKNTSLFVSRMGFANVNIKADIFVSIPLYLILPFCGEFCLLNIKKKWWIFGFCAVLFSFMLLWHNLI